MQRWGNIIIPWTVAWTGERRFTVSRCPYARTMALCQEEAPGVGKPDFGKPHSNRQRRAQALQLCDICAKPLKGRTRISLSQDSARHVDGLGLVPLAVEPMVHKECAVISLDQCPALKKQVAAGTIFIRQVSQARLIAQVLNEAATLEFAGVSAPGAVGHLKLAITQFVARDEAWLRRG